MKKIDPCKLLGYRLVYVDQKNKVRACDKVSLGTSMRLGSKIGGKDGEKTL